MLFYWQFRKKLAQTANKLNLQLVEIVNIVVTQAFTPPPQTRKQTKSILLSAVLYAKPPAWLSSSNNLCHAVKDFHNYHTNKTIFKLGKNNFIRLPAPGRVAGLGPGEIGQHFSNIKYLFPSFIKQVS